MSAFGVDRETFARLDRLVDQALDLPADERERWLGQLGPEDAPLLPRLKDLLAAAGGGRLATLPKLSASAASPETGEQRSADAAGLAGGLVGPYRLIRILGEGGMGTVWLARRADGLLDRPVALKLPRDVRGLAERMAREREILAVLVHPGIARLYDAGIAEGGQPYLALEYVEGRPIDVHVREEKLDVPARLRLFLKVAAALAYAHGRLVVHLDLKPSNLLVTADGEVRLLDFGIATLLGGEAAGEAEPGGRVLTPAYASPEQILGEPIGIASDIWSLGVVLYELLVDARPYEARGGSRRALEEAILKAEPARPSEATGDPALRRVLRGDLDAIVLEALRRQPAERYPTVDAFAGDLERFLSGLPVRARRGGAVYRGQKLLRRHPLVAGAAAAAVAALLATTGVALWQARRALLERDRAAEAKDFIVSLLRGADPYLAGRTLTAADLLEQARGRIDSDLGDRPELRVELLTAIGSSLVHLQDLEAADRVLAEAVVDGTRSLGPRHPRTIRARLALTDLHRLRGRTEEMERELVEIVPALRQGGPEQLEELAGALRQSAYLAMARGRGEDAVRFVQESRDLAAARWGRRHRVTLLAEIVLVHAYVQTGQAASALETGEHIERLALELFGGNPRHPQVIQARLTHALAVGIAGDRSRAVDLTQAGVDDARAVFGPESTVMAFALPRLVQAQVLVGELEGALAEANAAFRAASGRAGPESIVMAAVLDARGRALLAARRLDEAVPDLAAVARIEERVAGPSHPRAVAARLRLALAAGLAGEPGLAAEALGPAPGSAPGGAATPPTERLLVGGTLARLAADPDRARQLHREAMASIEEGPDAGWARARVLAQLGLDEVELGEHRAALASLGEAARGHRQFQRRATPDLADVLVGLGRAHLALAEPGAGLPALEEADTFWRGFDGGNRAAGEAALWHGRALEALGRRSEAEAARRRAAEILDRRQVGPGTWVNGAERAR